MRITSVFNSISGEVGGWPQGTPTTFIRLAGCNLKCTWCDAPHSQSRSSGQEWSIQQICQRVWFIGCRKVLITGGEPLLQTDLCMLTEKLKSRYADEIALETNGTVMPYYDLLQGFDHFIIDYKLPGSGYTEGDNIEELKEWRKLLKWVPKRQKWIKFVMMTEEDWTTTMMLLGLFPWLIQEFSVAFSPVLPYFPADKMFTQIQQKHLWDVTLNVQVHKYVFPDGEKGDE